MVPVKALPSAKSRLAVAVPDPGQHAALVRAIRADTLAAVRRAASVARIVVVADAGGVEAADAVEVILQTEPGLNAGLRAGAEYAARRWPDDGVAALMADLPALQPEELDAALLVAAAVPAAFVADATGAGTTLLTAAPRTALNPAFGRGSAARHARQAHPVAGGPGLRHDVDTEADLFRALDIGAGPLTRTAAAAVTSCSR